jgi:broad specificity phosphatase PhoE
MSSRESASTTSGEPIGAEVGPKVFLIRHADASEGEKDPDRGRSLTEIGAQQAEALARRMSAWQVDAIFCSDMTRARETAAALHRHHPSIPLIVDPDFREVSTGTLEDEHDALDGKLQARLASAWDKVLTMPYPVSVIVTHNGLIKYLIGRTIRHEKKLKPRFHSTHTGVTALQVRSKGRPLLRFFNDTKHLTPGTLAPGEKAWIEDPVTRRWRF